MVPPTLQKANSNLSSFAPFSSEFNTNGSGIGNGNENSKLNQTVPTFNIKNVTINTRKMSTSLNDMNDINGNLNGSHNMEHRFQNGNVITVNSQDFNFNFKNSNSDSNLFSPLSKSDPNSTSNSNANSPPQSHSPPPTLTSSRSSTNLSEKLSANLTLTDPNPTQNSNSNSNVHYSQTNSNENFSSSKSNPHDFKLMNGMVPFGPAFVYGGGHFDLGGYAFHPGVQLPTIAPSNNFMSNSNSNPPLLYSPIKPSYSYSVSRRQMAQVGNKRANTAEKRANHNAIERARRDSLNNRFQEIADCIPELREIKKPSKSTIMQKTFQYIVSVQKRLDHQNKELQALKKENAKLKESNQMLRNFVSTVPNAPEYLLHETLNEGRIKTESDFLDTAGIKLESHIDYTQIKNEFEINSSSSPSPTHYFNFDPQFQSHDFHKGGGTSNNDNNENDDDDDFDDENENETQLMSEGNDMQMNQHEFELNNSDVYLHSNQPNGFQGQTDERGNNYDILTEFGFNFDEMKTKIQAGLADRHTREFLVEHNILKDGDPRLQATQQAMNFHMKRKQLNRTLSSRPSVENLIEMNIMQQDPY